VARSLSERDHAALKRGLATLRSLGGGVPDRAMGRAYMPGPRSYVANERGILVPAYSCLKPTDVSLDGETPVVTIDRPGLELAEYYLASRAFPIAAESPDNIDQAFVNFPCLWKYAESEDPPVFGQHWGPTEDSWELSPHSPGVYVLGVENETERLLRGISYKIDHLVGKADEEIPPADGDAPGSGLVTIWIWDGESEFVATAWEVTAYNLANEAVQPHVFLQMKNYVGLWLIDFEPCPV
jgi:hypothetical protein